MKNYVIPDLNNVLEILKKDIYSGLRTLTIGQVIEFHANKRTVDAKIIIMPTNVQINTEVSDRKDGLEYPILYQVPVLDCEYFSPPIHANDYCLLIFAERNIDNWLVEDSTELEPRDNRMHSIADAFAWFGIGNFQKSTFIQPDDYKPPHDLPSLSDCPIPKYGYQPNLARVRYDCGEINLGHEWDRNGGVTIVARDYTNINMFAEGSDGNPGAGNIQFFPTNSFRIMNSFCNVFVHGDSDDVFDPNNEDSGTEPPYDKEGGGKISIFNDKYKKIIGDDPEKPNNWWAGKKVVLSDIYRIFAQCKALLDNTYKEFEKVYSTINDVAKSKLDGPGSGNQQIPTELTEAGIMDFKQRYSSLFAPADPEEGE